LKLYLTAVTATKRAVGTTLVSARAIAVLANNEDEGFGKALRLGKNAMPISEEWAEHEVSGGEISSETMRVWATAYGYVPDHRRAVPLEGLTMIWTPTRRRDLSIRLADRFLNLPRSDPKWDYIAKDTVHRMMMLASMSEEFLTANQSNFRDVMDADMIAAVATDRRD